MELIVRLQPYALKRAISTAIAILLTFVVANYFHHRDMVEMLLTAFIAHQTARYAPIKQGLYTIVVLIIALTASYLIRLNFNVPIILIITGSVMVIVGSLITQLILRANKLVTFYTFSLLFFLVVMLLPIQSSLYDLIIDIIIAGVIGLVCSLFIFPWQTVNEFRNSLIPILNNLIDYSQTTRECIQSDIDLPALDLINLQYEERRIIHSLQSPEEIYPEWVYDVGFNPGLRAGFRFFLLNLERITELYFSIHYYVLINMKNWSEKSDYDEILKSITVVFENNEKLINLLIEYFKNNTSPATTENFSEDVAKLEVVAQRILPGDMELLAIQPEYLSLTAIMRDIRDLRSALLQLVISLPV